MEPTQFARRTAGNLIASWRDLVVADLLYKLVAFVLLTPLFAALLRCILAFGGQSVLSDVDIVMFFVGPLGWCCAILLGAVWLAIIALEQASLLVIIAARSKGQSIGAMASLSFAARNSSRILRVTAEVIFRSLLVAAPFLLIAGVVYYWLLGQYDINYYLNARPTEFKVAVGVGASLAAALVGILLRIYSGWFLALPLVLFDQVPANKSLRASRDLVIGNRRKVLIWLVTWLLVVLSVNALLTATVGFAGRLLIPSAIGSLVVLAARVGLMLFVFVAAGLMLNLLATIGFAGTLFEGYLQIKPGASASIDALPVAERTSGGYVLTRPRLAAVGIVGALLATLIGYGSLGDLRLEDEVQIMAHRGSSVAAPENTMAAFRQAIDDGADWIEIDVQETADGEVVVLHDSDFMKQAGNPIKIWDAKLRDLENIDIGSWLDPKFAEERVPTLADVLRLCRDKVGVNIELKYYGHDQQLEQRVVEVVESEGMADQVMVMSLKAEGIAKVRALRPSWKCGLLLSVYVGNLRDIDTDFLAVNSMFATRKFVRRAHKSEKQVFVWTVNDAPTISQALNRNVDGILTDRPRLVREVLTQRASMSTAERLLTELALMFNRPSRAVEP